MHSRSLLDLVHLICLIKEGEFMDINDSAQTPKSR